MFATDITLAGDASSTQTYSLTSIVNGKAIRANAAAAAGAEQLLTVSHGPKSSAANAPLRHLVRIDTTKSDLTGASVVMSVYTVLEVPRTIVTAAQVQDAVTQLKNFLSGANVTKLLNSEP